MHVPYILKSQSNLKLYIGTTSNLVRRFKEHNEGSSTYTKSRGPWKMVYCEVCISKGDALERERKLKQFKNSYTELKKRTGRSLEDS